MSDLTVLIDATRRDAPDLGRDTAHGSPAGIPESHVDVVWEHLPVVVPPAVQAHLDARWNAYLADAQAHGKSLFDGPITRLIAARHEASRVVLHLGPADYKTFLVTRLRDRPWFEANAPDVAVGALGNSALLTRGNQAIFGIRSARVSAYPRRAHVLGGVLEKLGTEKLPASAGGMVAHLRMELHEEAGLGDTELAGPAWPRLLAVLQDEFLAQPEAVWQWEVTVPLEVLRDRLSKDEHAGCIVVDRAGVSSADWELMTPVARHAWSLWAGRRPSAHPST